MVVVADDAHDSRLLYEVNGLKIKYMNEVVVVVYDMQQQKKERMKKQQRENNKNGNKQMVLMNFAYVI